MSNRILNAILGLMLFAQGGVLRAQTGTNGVANRRSQTAATAGVPDRRSQTAATGSQIAATGGVATATVASKAPVTTSMPLSMETLDDKHTLVIGDHLSYLVMEDEAPPTELIVADSGDLEVPLAKGENGMVQMLNRYPVLGMTCKNLAYVLKKDLEKDYYKRATVILAVDNLSARRGRIYITGAVRAPGSQEIPSDEVFTLSKAILHAGGFNEFAKGKKVQITRKNPKGGKDLLITVDVEKILKGNREGDIELEADDFIFVEESGIRF